jgi:hypothetical protein
MVDANLQTPMILASLVRTSHERNVDTISGHNIVVSLMFVGLHVHFHDLYDKHTGKLAHRALVHERLKKLRRPSDPLWQ